MLSGRSIFLSHSKGLGEVLQSVEIEKYKQKKYVFDWDVVHLEFMQNLVKCKDRVINIAGVNAFWRMRIQNYPFCRTKIQANIMWTK